VACASLAPGSGPFTPLCRLQCSPWRQAVMLLLLMPGLSCVPKMFQLPEKAVVNKISQMIMAPRSWRAAGISQRARCTSMRCSRPASNSLPMQGSAALLPTAKRKSHGFVPMVSQLMLLTGDRGQGLGVRG